MLKVNEYGERQAKGNEKNLCFKGWETLVKLYGFVLMCIGAYLIWNCIWSYGMFWLFSKFNKNIH